MKNTKEIIIEQLFYSHEFNLCKKKNDSSIKNYNNGFSEIFFKKL